MVRSSLSAFPLLYMHVSCKSSVQRTMRETKTHHSLKPVYLITEISTNINRVCTEQMIYKQENTHVSFCCYGTELISTILPAVLYGCKMGLRYKVLGKTHATLGYLFGYLFEVFLIRTENIRLYRRLLPKYRYILPVHELP